MTARIGAPKTGGRVKGSLDKSERQLLTNAMAFDLMTVYTELGGVKWLKKFAQDNPVEFLRQGLSRLFPAPAKSDDDTGGGNTYNQINNYGDERGAALRVAYALARGVYGDPSVAEQVPGTTSDMRRKEDLM